MDGLQKVADLIDTYNAQLRFGANPLDVGMIAGIDSFAAIAFVARINGRARFRTHWVRAIQNLRERGGRALQFFGIVPAEKISVREPPAIEAALQKLHDASLCREVAEGHI